MDFQINGLPPQLGAMFAGEKQAADMAASDAATRSRLEQILASQQQRAIAEEQRAPNLQGLSLKNEHQGIENEKGRFDNNVRSRLGPEFYTKGAQLDQQERAYKAAAGFSSLLTDIGAEIEGIPNFRRQEYVRQRLKEAGAKDDIISQYADRHPDSMPTFFKSRAANLMAMMPKTGTQILTTGMREEGATQRNDAKIASAERIAQLRANLSRELAQLRASATSGKVNQETLSKWQARMLDGATFAESEEERQMYKRALDASSQYLQNVRPTAQPAPSIVPVPGPNGQIGFQPQQRGQMPQAPLSNAPAPQPQQDANKWKGWSADLVK